MVFIRPLWYICHYNEQAWQKDFDCRWSSVSTKLESSDYLIRSKI